MIVKKEREYLKELAKQYKELANSDQNNINRQKWYDINDLKKGAKAVFCNHYWPLALNEVLPQNTYRCESKKARDFERYFKTKIFYAQQLKDDNVMEPVVYSNLDFYMEDYGGLVRKVKRPDQSIDESDPYDMSQDNAYAMIPVITEKEDINKIKDPILHYNKAQSLLNYEQACEIFDPILTVIKRPHTMAAKIADEYSWLRGMENTYMDIYDDPEWLHLALDKITNNFIKRFKLLEEAGIWGTLDLSEHLGSAGLRYASGLPDFRDVSDPFNSKVKLSDSWGFTCAEVFECVSAQMHDEFSFDYDRKVMGLFKHINVGCCEVLDKKIDMVRGLKNTRKISVSEWCDVDHAGEQIKSDYVYSYRAAGTHFVNDNWDQKNAEKEIRSVLEASKKHGCNAEIVLNIGGTLGKYPVKKVVEWSQMVRTLINEYYD